MPDNDVAALRRPGARYLNSLCLGTVFVITGLTLAPKAAGPVLPLALADPWLRAATCGGLVGPFAVAFVGTVLAFAD